MLVIWFSLAGLLHYLCLIKFCNFWSPLHHHVTRIVYVYLCLGLRLWNIVQQRYFAADRGFWVCRSATSFSIHSRRLPRPTAIPRSVCGKSSLWPSVTYAAKPKKAGVFFCFTFMRLHFMWVWCCKERNWFEHGEITQATEPLTFSMSDCTWSQFSETWIPPASRLGGHISPIYTYCCLFCPMPWQRQRRFLDSDFLVKS